MHNFDPDGSLHAYRMDRQRHENWIAILVGLACGVGLLAVAGLAFIAISIFQQAR